MNEISWVRNEIRKVKEASDYRQQLIQAFEIQKQILVFVREKNLSYEKGIILINETIEAITGISYL